MNVLVIGSGGREHALALKISESKILEKLYCLPGNPGTELIAENVTSIEPDNFNAIKEFCLKNRIGLVVVGPEVPLVNGIEDFLTNENILVFGPSKKAAMLEGDKTFSKNLMKKYSIPTAGFEIFDKNEKEKAIEYLEKINYPTVIKAFGLAAGKGVLICNTKEEALEGIKECFDDNAFGEAGNKIIIEDFMVGEEASVFAITDGKDYVTLPVSQDHKRIGNNDTGKNTGGMGAYSPAPIVDENLLDKIKNEIISPTLKAMQAEGKPFKGCLYCGLMITKEGPKVVEFNCRFGDPETQAVLPLLDGDFLELLLSSAKGKINKEAVKYNGGSSVCVVAASNGYPGNYKKGLPLSGLENFSDSKDIIIYHAGTKKEGDNILTNGGRVLGITSFLKENNLKKAKEMAYKAISEINFDGIYYRNDISDKAFK